ncbi:hypothetical protein [Kribbia dieselivorans]|uniref:hypothetical protein n=1 Tax=Kribbia dieselivorans TaxID=331526 RepID=UPI0008394B1D|nr:hypothetical protein [Kribbia dieselivorans]
MSQLTLSRPVARPVRSTARTTPRDSLRLVSGQRAGGDRWFVALCLAVTVAGIAAVLLVNTVMAHNAFALTDLQKRSAELSAEHEALTNEIDAQKAPAKLAQRATRLGMVPGESAAFVDVGKGRVIGVAEPATKDPSFSVNTSPSAR